MNEFKVRKGLIVQGSGSNIFDVQGSQGQLFSVTDSLVGSLFSVNDISGIPIMEVFSDNTIKMGTFNQEAIIVSGSRTGMGTAFPQAELHISGANNDSLFRIQSPASASIIFVTGSGLVGIGTLTPTQKLSVDNGNVGFTSGFGISWDSDTEWIKRAAASDQLQIATQNTVRLNIGSTQGQLVAIGLGTNAASAQFQVRGGGATSGTTTMRIEDSGGNARLTILDDGTSAFNTNHLYVSGSGRVAVGTSTPQRLFDVYNGSTSGIAASFGAQISNNNFSGISFGYVEQANSLYRKSALVFERTETHGGGANASGKIHFLLNNNSSTSATALTDAVLTIDSVGTTVGSSRVGIGTRFPTASLHISGTVATDNLIRVQSTTGAEYFFISASGNIGIGTTTPTQRLDVRGNTIIAHSGITPINPIGGTLEVYNNGSNAQITIHEDSGSAEARLWFRTEGSDTIFRNLNTRFSIDVESKSDALTLSLGGRVGIGTSTSTPSSLLQVRGEGATSATTALRVENSNQDPEFIVLDNGNVGISTATPSDLLTINSPSNTGSLRLTHLSEIETLRATSFHSGLYIGNNIYYNGSGDPITNSSYAVDSGSNNRGGNLLLMRANNGTTALGGFYFYTAPSSSIANTTATLNESFRIIPSSSFFTNTRVGIGAAANTSYAFDIQSSAPNSGAARINGNNTVWVFDQASQVTRGTTTLSRMFLVQMGPVNASSGTQTALTVSQSISQSSTAGYTTLVVNANETGTGSGNKLLQAWQFNGTDRTVINNSGSLGIGIATPSASLHISGANNANLLRVSSPSASSALFISGSGNVGVGTATPAGLIDIFQGGNSRILVTTDNGFVGLQQSSPAERIHITSDPVNGKYLQIDAGQTSNAPRQVVDSPATAIIGYAAGDSTVYLSEPRWWMEIKLDGNIVLIPCYQPDV